MEQPNRQCALCGDPIASGEAWMTDESDGRMAHAGCVYRDEEPDDRHRWSPGDSASP